jgi:hypothetical protein
VNPLNAPLRNWVLAAAATAMLAACASGPDIRRDTNPAAQFGTYKTFGFFPQLATDKAGYESLFTSRMKEATRRVMESKGYTYTQDNPDLLLNFFANVQDKQEVRSTPESMHGGPYSMGYYGYRDPFYYGMSSPQVTTVNYKQGTVSIDLVDREKKILAWSATAEGRIQKKTLQNPGPVIDALAQELMAPLPAAPGSM